MENCPWWRSQTFYVFPMRGRGSSHIHTFQLPVMEFLPFSFFFFLLLLLLFKWSIHARFLVRLLV